MDIWSTGVIETRNASLLRTRTVTAGDLDVNGLLTLDFEGADPICPILDIDDSLTLNGLKITDNGVDVIGTVWGDGMFLYVKHSGVGGSPLLANESASVSAAYRFSNSSGSDLKITNRLLPVVYDPALGRWLVSAPFQQGDYTSSTVTNQSNITGASITEALNEAYKYLPAVTGPTPVVVAASPTYTTVYTVPCDVSTAYTAIVDVCIADDPATSVRSGFVRIIQAFHRNNTGNAVLDGTAVVQVSGGFGSLTGTAAVSGTNVVFQIRFTTGATVNVTVEAQVRALTPG